VIKLILSEIVEAMGGRPRGALRTVSVQGVSTDSRSVAAGDLFFALTGPRFDGHAFVADALRGGAVAAVVAASRAAEIARAAAQKLGPAGRDGALIEVDDPIAALGRLAAYHRNLLSSTRLIAVVGSNGKTTTKAMIHHILAGRMQGRCSPKNFNNEIGVPLTLLTAEAADEYMVVEVGTSAPGEVATLAGLVRPDMAVITSIAEEHLEGLGDLSGVAIEECSVLEKLDDPGFAAVNIDTPIIRQHLPKNGPTITTFGRVEDADLRLTEVRYEAPWLHFTVNGRFAYRLPIAGAHNALNAAGAITIARRLGLDHEEIAARLATFVLPPMRNEVLAVGGVTVVNDAYNANPRSALAALDVLESLPCRGRRIVVFGEMRELGGHSAALHRQVAQRLLKSRVDRVFLVGVAGELMGDTLRDGQLFAPPVERCPDVDTCLRRLEQELQEGDVLLLKASRTVGLERLVEPLRQRRRPTPVA
jgi:UDP-N-acetylmuramoyl-tripeptide--D-alanyl-D-alanine ligase